MSQFLFRAALLALMCLTGSPALSNTFTIAAAADLRFALDEIIEAFRDHHPQYQVRVVYGSSGKMTTQILNGAPYDLFFSADISFPERLHAAGMTASDPAVYALGRIVLWSNSLDASSLSLADLATDTRIRRIAIAQPAHAPYGQRAREALQAAGVWDAVQPKLVFGENIAHAAQMVESGAANVGIIALSLALFPRLAEHRYHLIDEQLHQPLTQGFVVTRRGANRPGVQAFSEFMAGEQAHTIMRRFGFAMPDADRPGRTD